MGDFYCFARKGLLFLAKPQQFPVMSCNYHFLLAVDGQPVLVRLLGYSPNLQHVEGQFRRVGKPTVMDGLV